MRLAAASSGGFSLPELLVVMLIIALLARIAIPTYLSVARGAGDTTVQQNLQSTLVGAKVYFDNPNTETFTGINGGAQYASSLTQQNLGLSFLTSNSASHNYNEVSVDVPSTATPAGSVLVLASWSPATNTCWGIVDVEQTQSGAVMEPASKTGVGTYYWGITETSGKITVNGCTAANWVTTIAPLMTASSGGWAEGGWPPAALSK